MSLLILSFCISLRTNFFCFEKEGTESGAFKVELISVVPALLCLLFPELNWLVLLNTRILFVDVSLEPLSFITLSLMVKFRVFAFRRLCFWGLIESVSESFGANELFLELIVLILFRLSEVNCPGIFDKLFLLLYIFRFSKVYLLSELRVNDSRNLWSLAKGV